MRSTGRSRRRIIGLLILSALLIITLAAPVWSQTPPVIDRELFFGDPEIAGAQISPDGAFIAFIKPFKGTRNVWVKKTAEPFANAKPITADTKRPIPTYFWSRDGKYILFVQDKAGDENYNVYAVNPADAPASPRLLRPLLDKKDWDRIRSIWSEAAAGDGRVELECQIRRQRDGARRWVQFRGQMFFGNNRRPVRAVGIMIDASDRRQAEERQRLEGPARICRIHVDEVVVHPAAIESAAGRRRQLAGATPRRIDRRPRPYRRLRHQRGAAGQRRARGHHA